MLAAALGWLGTIGTFVAYAMLWKGWLTSESRRYALLNTVGGLLGGTASAIYGAWPSAAANFAWAALGVHSMVETHRRRRLEVIVNEIPDFTPATSQDAASQERGAASEPLERAFRTQAACEAHRSPACVIPQLP